MKWLDPMMSVEFETCTTFEKRITMMFESIKQKWTIDELGRYLKGTLEPEQNMTVLLSRNSRTVKEKNPFDATKSTTFYVKKF